MKYIIVILSVAMSSCCFHAQPRTEIETNRELLRDYFLYKCISTGYNELEISEYDHSAAVYMDLLRYELIAKQRIDSVAIGFVNTIPISPLENRNTRGIIILSIEKYKSDEIKTFIRSLDKYMLKD